MLLNKDLIKLEQVTYNCFYIFKLFSYLDLLRGLVNRLCSN